MNIYRAYLISFFTASFLGGCAHHRSVLADPDEVKVSREDAAARCRSIGRLEGLAATASGTQEQALADLKREAANKGANFVVVKEYSAYGTAVTGTGYVCP